ncbi:MAG: HD-GYP domain-containing protein [Clostridium sp.]|uniref:HD-GYP domain-containing protein n=1 Tax=Clostridium sp. TaxID=1506 RepID=UPI003F2DEB3A
MRLIPIESVREGSFLARTIYADDGRILLKEGIALKENLIRKIKENNIHQIYAVDEYSLEEIEDIIRPELRQKSITTLKEVFTNITKAYDNNLVSDKHAYLDSVNLVAEEILNNILDNENIMISLVDIKTMDNYTYQHSVNVAIISVVIGIGLRLPKSELLHLCIGSLLHDIGKVFIPNDIIKKPAALTDEEFELIKTHSQKGYDYFSNNYLISSASKLIIKQHHERVDGLGYPNRLHSNEIFKLSKIVSIADVYDALTSNRPYRKPIHPNDAVEYIMAHSGTLFDHKIVKVFSKFIIPYPTGTLIELSTGDICIVESNNYRYPLRPIVKIVKGTSEDKNGKIIDLLYSLSIVIISVKYYID